MILEFLHSVEKLLSITLRQYHTKMRLVGFGTIFSNNEAFIILHMVKKPEHTNNPTVLNTWGYDQHDAGGWQFEYYHER